MMEEEFISRIRLATELATKKIIAIHRKSKEDNYKVNSKDKNAIYEYESLFRAMIYHELMMLGIYFGDVTMDNSINSDKEGLRRKKPDIWIENTEKGESYALEIKTIRQNKKTSIIDEINNDKSNSIVGDIKKLSEAMRDESFKINGIMVISYQSPNYDEDDDTIDVMDNEIRKIVKKINPPHDFIIMLCSEDSCRVFHVMDILKK